MFGKKQIDADSEYEDHPRQLPPELRRKKRGLLGLFRKPVVEDEEEGGWKRSKTLPPELQRKRKGPFGLFGAQRNEEKEAFDAARKNLPSEVYGKSKTPLQWLGEQFLALLRLPLILFGFLRHLTFRLSGWAALCASLAAGGVLGALTVRYFYNRQEPVVSVRADTITADQFYHQLEADAGPEAVKALANETLLLQFARQKRILPTEAQINARARELVSNEADAEAARQRHLTQEDLHDAALRDLVEKRLFGAGAAVTDAEIQSYYTWQSSLQNPAALFRTPEKAEISLIMSPLEKDIRQAQKDLDRGEPFEKTAKTYSKDKSALGGGQIAPVFRGRSVLRAYPGLEDLAFSLQPGQNSTPKQSGGLWWILRCRSRAPASVQPLESVREQCRLNIQLIRASKTQAANIAQDFAAFRKKAKIQVFADQYLYDL